MNKYYTRACNFFYGSTSKNLIKRNQKIDMDEIIRYALKKKMKVVTYPLYENWIDLGIRKNLEKYQKSKNSN